MNRPTGPGSFSASEQPQTQANGAVIRFGDCELHLPTRELWLRGALQPVRKRVFDLLLFLINHRPTTVTHSEIGMAAWGRAHVRPSSIAQTLMEVRRAVGDDLDEPVHILTVRGIGYRFASTLVPIAPGNGNGNGNATGSGDLSEVRLAVDQARAAVVRGDSSAAQFLGERAIQHAEAAGANVLKAQALSVAAWASLHRGSREAAVRYAFEALRLAEAEDHRSTIVDARLRVAQVLSFLGDLYGALQKLDAVRVPHDLAEEDPDAQRWASLGCFINAELLRFDEAATWHERAMRISLKQQPSRAAVGERIGGIYLALKRADTAEAAGLQDQALEHFAQALALGEALREHAFEFGDEAQRICWFGNHGFALTGLGRLEEAWSCAEQATRMMEASSQKGSPWYAAHLNELRRQWACLYHKTGRYTEALEQLELAVAQARAAGHHGQVHRLALFAARVCESARLLEAALGWIHQAQAAQRLQQAEQAACMAMAYNATSDRDRLMLELQTTRARLSAAQAQVQELSDQVKLLLQAGSLGGSGLLQLAAFEPVLRQRADDARARDLPSLVGLILVEPCKYAAEWDSSAARQALFGSVAAEIRAQLGAAPTLVCAWSASALAFTIDGMGARRAGIVCQTLQKHLSECGFSHTPIPRAWLFTTDLFDLCSHDGFEQALEALRRLHPPGDRASGAMAVWRAAAAGALPSSLPN